MRESVLIGALIGALIGGIIVFLIGAVGKISEHLGKKIFFLDSKKNTQNMIIGLISCVMVLIALMLLKV